MAERKTWTDIEEVAEQVTLAGQLIGRNATTSFIAFATHVLQWPRWSAIESPLEAIFWVWWQAATSHLEPPMVELHCQREIRCASGELFRLDFVVEPSDARQAVAFADAGKPFPLIVVEVDGHGFHEKTLEQVALRNTRDRLLQQEGAIVFHFSWSEMIQKGYENAAAVYLFAEKMRSECQAVASAKWEKDHPEERQRMADIVAGISTKRG